MSMEGEAICKSELKMVYKLTTRTRAEIRIPLDYSKLQEDEWCVLLNATEDTQKPIIKPAYKDSRISNLNLPKILPILVTKIYKIMQ